MTTPDPIAKFQAAADANKAKAAEPALDQVKAEEVVTPPAKAKPTPARTLEAKPEEVAETPKAEPKPETAVATTQTTELAKPTKKLLINYTEEELLALSDEEMEAIWLAEKTQKEGKRFNEIKLITEVFLSKEDGGGMNPDFGKLFANLSTGESEEIDIATAKFFTVDIRVQIRSAYNEAESRGEYSTPEISNLEEEFEIKSNDGGEQRLIAYGKFFELRKQYELGSKDVFYVYHNGNFYRWLMSVGDFNLSKNLKKMIGASPEPITFKVTDIEEVTTKTGKINKVHFAASEPIAIVQALKLKRQFQQSLRELKGEGEEEVNENAEAIGEMVAAEDVPVNVNPAELPA